MAKQGPCGRRGKARVKAEVDDSFGILESFTPLLDTITRTVNNTSAPTKLPPNAP